MTRGTRARGVGRRFLASCAAGAVAAAILLSEAGPRGAAASQGPQAVRFVDVAPRSTFAYRTNNHYTGRKYFPQPMAGGIAVLDFDADGRLDLFFSNGAELPSLRRTGPEFHNSLLRNLGGGRFEDVTEKAGLRGEHLGYGYGVAAADYDNDGLPDLFIAGSGPNALYHNEGAGRFRDVTEKAGLAGKAADLLSVCAAFFDFDNDGLLDLLVSNYTHWLPDRDRVCFRRPGEEIYCSPTYYPSVPHTLYRNLGGGRFADVTEAMGLSAAAGKGMGIAVADFDDDGFSDAFVANDTERNFLYHNEGGRRFEESGVIQGVAYNDRGTAVSSMGADAKDFDNDGFVDVLHNDLTGQVFNLFLNQKGRFFLWGSARTGLERLSRTVAGWSCGFLDYDNDGWKDIYSSNGEVDPILPNAKQHDTIYRNVDGKSLVDVSQELGSDFLFEGYQRGSAFADLDDDGFQDLVVTSLGERPRILMSSGMAGRHWLLVEARGTRSNRDGIGAKMKLVTASGRTLWNHVTTSVGFMGSSDPRVHFGLGEETSVRELEIRWPSGVVQRLANLRADQILRVRESEGERP